MLKKEKRQMLKRASKKKEPVFIPDQELKESYSIIAFHGAGQTLNIRLTKETILHLRKEWSFQDAWEKKEIVIKTDSGMEVMPELVWSNCQPGEARIKFAILTKKPFLPAKATTNQQQAERFMRLIWPAQKLSPGKLYLFEETPVFFLHPSEGCMNTFLEGENKVVLPAFEQLRQLEDSTT